LHVLAPRKNPLRIAPVVKIFHSKFRHALITGGVGVATLMPEKKDLRVGRWPGRGYTLPLKRFGDDFAGNDLAEPYTVF